MSEIVDIQYQEKCRAVCDSIGLMLVGSTYGSGCIAEIKGTGKATELSDFAVSTIASLRAEVDAWRDKAMKAMTADKRTPLARNYADVIDIGKDSWIVPVEVAAELARIRTRYDAAWTECAERRKHDAKLTEVAGVDRAFLDATDAHDELRKDHGHA